MSKQKPKQKKNTQQKSSLAAYYIILALVSFAVYSNSLYNDFVFDDESVVQGDPTIMELSNIPKFFTGEMGFHKVIGAYYRPVVSSSFAIDYALWKFNPFGFHLTNVLMHMVNVLLFFALLRLMFTDVHSKFKDYAILIGALVFAVHPIHTEVVAWVSGRTDGLACTFFFASFIFYLKYSRENKNSYFALTLVMYLLALFSKEMAITLPAVIILYDLIVNKISIKEILKKKAVIYGSLVVVSILFVILRWSVLSTVTPRTTYFYFFDKDFATTFFTMLQTVPLYFRLSIAPYGMLYHYSGYLPYISSPFEIGALIAIAVIAALGFVAYYFYRRMPYVTFAILLFFITLLPVMNIVPTMNFVADRFLYIPSMFFSIIICSVILKYYTEKNSNIILGAAVVVLAVYGYMTVTRNMDWKTNDTLFLSAEGKPGTVTYVNLGNMLAKKGDYANAEVYYRKALALRDEIVIANVNVGKVFMIKNNFDSAYHYMKKGYSFDTLSPEPMHALAQLFARNQRIPESIEWLEKIQKVTPNYMNSAQMLQELKMEQQMKDAGIQQDTTKNTAKADIMKLENSSYNFYKQKEFDKAISELKQLIKLNPENSSGYYNNMGMCYLDQGKYNEAIESFNQSVKADPKFSTGYNNLGQCYEKMGDKQKAAEYFKKAFEADPNNQIAKDNYERVK
jgi:protein O-mannosyl-transferase